MFSKREPESTEVRSNALREACLEKKCRSQPGTRAGNREF